MAPVRASVSAARLCEDAWELTLSGELDLHDAPTLQRAFDDAATAGAARVLVDLSSVPFVDSTILGVLMRASKRFAFLVLAVGDVRVLRVLEITGLDRSLRIERSRQEALAALTARAAA